MKFYDAAKQHVVEAPNARWRFFVLGPFHLLWQRLYLDALACALLIWAVVHGSVIGIAAAAGTDPGLNGQAVMRAFHALRDATDLGLPADDAYRHLVEASLPFYTIGLVLLCLMGVLTYFVPSYLRWRYRRMGFVELVDVDTESLDSDGALS